MIALLVVVVLGVYANLAVSLLRRVPVVRPLAPPVVPSVPAITDGPHYLVQHTHGGQRRVLYDGHDSDAMHAAFLRMEHDRDGHPGVQELLINGVPRVRRPHDEPPV